MQLKADNLHRHLKNDSLLTAYLISGEEPLLMQEAADLLRITAREQGFTEREVFNVDSHFDWDGFITEANSPSLFADRKILELRLTSAKLGEKGNQALDDFFQSANPDNLLLVLAPKLSKSELRSKWVSSIDKAGVVIQVWPVSPEQLPAWIGRRLQQRGMKATPQATEILAARVEGNLLAASQEIEKLELLTLEGVLDETTISSVVAESARYNLFSLCDKALEGDCSAACRILQGLKNEGTEATAILWLLTREIRVLKQLCDKHDAGQHLDAALAELKVWKSRTGLMKRAVQRMSSAKANYLLRLARATDKAIKGVRNNSPWDDLLTLVVMLSGQNPLSPESLKVSLRSL